MASYVNKYNIKSAVIKRWLRTFLPQVPALISVFVDVKPEWTAILVFLGAVTTSLDKLFRETGFYDDVKSIIQP